MSPEHNAHLVELFEVPVVYLEDSLVVTSMNDRFHSLFGDVTGSALSVLSHDFNEKKFARKVAGGQPYSVTIIPAVDKRSQYTLTLKRYENHFVGFAVDTSESAKTEAMLASYSALIEKQNREIKAKTAQVNLWRNRIQNELEQAATVQDLLVPKQVITTHLDSRCEPLQELSGDFHELATHDDGQITFISGDVAGKGIYAAIMLAQTLTAFRASFTASTLTDVAYKIVSMLEDRFPDGLFVAMILIRQSADKQTVSVLNLGNPDVLLIDESGVCEQIPSVGPAIGILPAEIYANLEPWHRSLTGKRLYAFSDGVLDIKLGGDYSGFSDAEEVGHYLSSLDANFKADALTHLISIVRDNKQIDDVTIACFSPDPLFAAS